MMDPKKRMDKLTRVLREQGYRITPQRLAILNILAESNGHPSVEQIYTQVLEDFPTTSLATVYKTVNLLKSIGEVLELSFRDQGNRYDGNKPYPHPHVICTGCGRIVDPEYMDIEKLSKIIAGETGFEISHHRLDFYGLCPECRKKK